MRVTKRLMAALLACLMLLSLLPVPAYAADDGRIALLAVTQDGYVIEPEYIGYRSGDTVKDVLKNSGHTFSGIDSGFITAVDGRTDNYSLHYDGDGYALDASAKGLTAIWFTTNANQSYGDDLLHLAERMAAYNTSTNGLKDYAAAKEAYDAAHSGFYAATNAAAAPLRTALEKAIDKFEAFQAGDRVTVTIAATQDGSAVTPAQATFTSEFGTVTTVKNAGSVQLVPATYQFDLSDGGINHVRGTVEVTAQGAAVSAPLPSGKWIKELRLGIDNQWKDGEDVPKFDETDGGATFWVPDYSYGTLYPYMVPGDGIGTAEGQMNVRVYLAGVETLPKYARSWQSKATALSRVLPGSSLEGGDVVLEARYAVDGYEQYQPYTLHVLRTPSLTDLVVSDASARLKLDFDKKTLSYTVATTEDTVTVTASPLCAQAKLTVAGKAAQGGAPVNVTLAGCQKNGKGQYIIPVELTFEGRAVTYTVLVEKRESVLVTLEHEQDVTVELTNSAGAVIAPRQQTGTADVYALVPGDSYTYVSTKNSYFHTTAAVKASAGLTVQVPTPIVEDWLKGLDAKSGTSAKAIPYPMTPAFSAGVHEYDFAVESNNASFFLNRARTDSTYVTTMVYYGHYNTNFADKLVLDYTTSLGQRVPEIQLTLRPLSGYRLDADMTVTVACGDWSQTLTYDADNRPNVLRTVNVPLNTALQTETVTVTVSHSEPTSVAQTYSIRINKLPPVETTVTTDPADATVFLTSNVNGQRILPGETGTYTLDTNGAYTLVVTRSGYVGQKLDVIAGEDSKNITVKLEKAPESTHNDILQPGDWPLFRADSNNNGVVSAPTPITAEDAVLVWANKVGEGYGASAASCPIIAGGYLYAYARDKLLKIDKDTGAVVGQGTMVTSSSFAINSPTYADGMIFVALSGGRIQAFDAESLESLWVYTDPLGGQPNCPIAYCGGYIYTGFWNSETKQANFAGISVTDEDPTQTQEAKLAAWTYTHNGFYWAGAYACENFVLVTTDDGDSGYTTGYGSVLSLDPKTGVLLDQLKATNVGDLRSSVCYDPATDAYYFTSKGGDLYQVRTNEDGTFVEGSLNRLHLDNGGNDDSTPPMSTSTPVIHNGRAYIGVSGTSQFGAYSGHNMTVVDLESFSIAYTVPTQGYPQTSGLLTTAYEDQDGYAYVYFFDNYTPGKLRVLRDKPGMTEVDHTYTTMETYNGDSGEVTIETGYVLFTPSGAQAQYAICSPIVDGEGNIYFKNDSAYMMRLSSRVTALEITRQPERTVYEIGETFDGAGMQVTALLANGMTRDVTDYVKFTAEPLTAEDTEITVSLDLTRLDIPGGPNWVFYQNRDGQTGQEWTCPTGTVNIELKDGHVYGQPVWTWNDDFSAYAEFACTVNPRHEKLRLDAQVTSEITTGSSCLEGGVRTYTAKVVLDGVTYTDVRTQPIPADGHKLSAVAEVPAACTENGVKAHWVCSVCGKLFADAEGQKETTLEALTIPALGHKTQLVGAKPATCTEDGYTGDEVCTVCGETIKKGEVIPATGHKTQLVGAKAATCTEDGYTGDQVCTVCGETVKKGEVIPATGHKTQLVGAKAATCTEDGYTGDEVCTVCQEIVKKGETIPATGHDYKDGKCTVCGETDPNYKPDEPVQPENPGVKTGDEAHTALWLAAASVSLLAAAALLLGKKKHLS